MTNPCYARSVKRLLVACACAAFAVCGLSAWQSVITPAPPTTGVVAGSVVQLAKTTLQATTPVYTVGGATQSFQIAGAIYCTTSSAAATATLTVSYTDPSNTAQTIVPTLATCTTLGAASISTMNSTIRAKNGTAINYAVAIASTPTFDVSVQVIPLSVN